METFKKEAESRSSCGLHDITVLLTQNLTSSEGREEGHLFSSSDIIHYVEVYIQVGIWSHLA